jgi:hypothetical protein
MVFDYGTHLGYVKAYEISQWIAGYFVFVVAIASGIAAGAGLIAIFLYKFPLIQKLLCILAIAGMLFSFFFVLYQWYFTEYKMDTLFYYGNIAPWVIIVLFALAFRSISKDENLLKSYDRMR